MKPKHRQLAASASGTLLASRPTTSNSCFEQVAYSTASRSTTSHFFLPQMGYWNGGVEGKIVALVACKQWRLFTSTTPSCENAHAALPSLPIVPPADLLTYNKTATENFNKHQNCSSPI